MRTPRRMVHHGTVQAAGYLFPSDLPPSAIRNRRILEHWRPGARLFRLDDGALVLRLAEPETVACQRAPGLPLTERGGALMALPLDEPPPPGSVARMDRGRLRVEPLSQPVDPAELLTVEGFHPVVVRSLGAPPPPPRPALPEAATPRDALGVAPPDPQRTALLEALRRAAEGLGGGADPRAAPARRAFPWPWLRGNPSYYAPPPRLRPTWMDRLRDRLTRLALQTRLAQHLSRQHARHLRKMMELFERGEWADALRHAIPLGGGDEREERLLTLGALRPRDNLDLTFRRTPGGAALPWGGLYDNLHSLYRNAFEKLVEAGRIEEAAFVLAELLNADEEAVAFLEKHGRLKQAAELAEGRGCAPGLVVRQWWIAGDRDRAVGVARRSAAFADAIARLQKTDPEQAGLLRQEWAEHCARAGNYAGAVEAAWPLLEALRPLLEEWVARTVEVGGRVGARMLARQALLADETRREEVRAAILEMLNEPDAAERREAFAEALAALPPFPDRAPLARRTVRALWGDLARTPHRPTRPILRALTELTDDALRADRPPLPRPALEPTPFAPPLEIVLAAADTGALAIHDVARLPDGRLLAALGELGVRLLTPDGRTLVHFDRPAHRLIVSDHGDRAIAAGRRGESWRLTRLDLVARRATDWTEARFAHLADTYDGATLLGALDDGLYAIDALADGFAFVWRMRELPGPIVALQRWPGWLSLLLQVRGATPLAVSFQRWSYELPSLTLRHRFERPLDEALGPLALPVDGQHTMDLGPFGDPPALQLAIDGFRNPLGASGQKPLFLRHQGAWVLAALADPDTGIVAHLIGYSQLFGQAPFTPRATLRFDGAQRLCARFSPDDHLILADDRGRLLDLDLKAGVVHRDLRLRP